MAIPLINLLEDPNDNEIKLWKNLVSMRSGLEGANAPLAGWGFSSPGFAFPGQMIILGPTGNLTVDATCILHVDIDHKRVGVNTCSPLYPLDTYSNECDEKILGLHTSQLDGDVDLFPNLDTNPKARIRSSRAASTSVGTLRFYTSNASDVLVEQLRVSDLGVTVVNALTPGSVPFIKSDGTLTENNANLFWSSASTFLALGSAGDRHESSSALSLERTAIDAILEINTHSVGSNSYLIGYRSRGTHAVPTIVSSGDFVLGLSGKAYDGVAYRELANVFFKVDGTPGSGDMPGRIEFNTTADGASAVTERFRISNFGGLGIAGANYGTAGQYHRSGGATTVTSWATIAASEIGSGAALTVASDTNIVLTLGGTPASALLKAASVTASWTGTLADARLSTTAVTAAAYGSATQSPTFTVSATGRLTAAANVTIAPLASSIASPAALSKADDTNVTLTLTGSPTIALLAAATITAGWTGTLSVARGGTSLSAAGHLLNTTLWDDVTASTVSRGDLITGQGASAKWNRLGKGAALQVVSMDGTGTDVIWADAAAGSATTVGLAPGGRLTLTTATPVLTATVNNSASIYYALYTHDRVPIYNGSSWTMTVFTELTNTTTDNTKNPAAVANNSNYDLFVWSDTGTLRLGRGPAWTSDTARGTGAGTTELERINGVWMNKIAITNGPAVNRGTYVGTVRSNGSSQIDWQFGTLAANGGAGILGVWNMHNRVNVTTLVRDSTDSWTYATATWRALNNSTTNRVSYVSGLAEDAFEGRNDGFTATSAFGGNPWEGVGYDDVTTLAGTSISLIVVSAQGPSSGSYTTQSLGYHFMSAIEYANTGTQTYYGDLGVPSFVQTGFTFRGRF